MSLSFLYVCIPNFEPKEEENSRKIEILDEYYDLLVKIYCNLIDYYFAMSAEILQSDWLIEFT